MQKAIAEFIGTFTLVLLGCGAAIFAGDKIGYLGIALTFGLAIVALAYGIGPISGGPVNPAVSLGAFVAGRIGMSDLINYVIAQCLGAIAAAAVLFVIVSGKTGGYDIAANGFATSGWGAYSMVSAFIFEAVATFLFLVTILGVTQKGSPTMLAGLAIGLTLTAIHLAGIPVSGSSVNPARSLGPALFGGTAAISQLWLYIVAPCLGAAAAGMLFRTGAPLDANQS